MGQAAPDRAVTAKTGSTGRLCLAWLAGLAAWPALAFGLRNVTGPEYFPLPFFLAYLLPLGAGLPALLVAGALVPCRCRLTVALPLLVVVNAGLPFVAWWRPQLVLTPGTSAVGTVLPPLLLGLAAGGALLALLTASPTRVPQQRVVAVCLVAVLLLWVGAKAYHATMVDRTLRLLRPGVSDLVQTELLAGVGPVQWDDVEIVGTHRPYALRLRGSIAGQPGLAVVVEGLSLVPRGRLLTVTEAFAPGSPVQLRVTTAASPLPLRPQLVLPGLHVAVEGASPAVRAVTVTAGP